MHGEHKQEEHTSSEKPISRRRSASSSTRACRSSSPTDWVLRRWSISLPCRQTAGGVGQTRAACTVLVEVMSSPLACAKGAKSSVPRAGATPPA